ncbi:TPA: UvrD-helicase domain-containing protein [Photobacterium damselae]
MIDISSEDINAVESTLGLTFDETRRRIITTYDDVQACPGSGKTTIVAAKLMILAKKWEPSNQGICVLTHTNVAKEEIIERLSTNSDGQKLLSFPHFIGTIQEFVNKFLAIPYLRSGGYPISHIDDEICNSKGWSLLNVGTKRYLEQRRISSLDKLQYRFVEEQLVLDVPGFNSVSTSSSYRNLESVKATLLNLGCFFFHEMYAFAEHYLLSNPSIYAAIRSRFPYVFIDEMQDTQKFQDELLNKIFNVEGVSFQRFGDPDQAIYSGEQEENESYNRIELSRVENSHRFTNSIAALAKNLSYNRINLQAASDVSEHTFHTIFLVDDNSRNAVFRKFAELCAQAIPEGCQRKIKTVGAVGTRKDDGLTICNYLDSFDKSSSVKAFKPSKLIHYLFEGRRQKDYHLAYSLVLDGISRLGRKAGAELVHQDGNVAYSASAVRRHLKQSNQTLDFNLIVRGLIVDDLSAQNWESAIQRLCSIFALIIPDGLEEFISFDSDNLEVDNAEHGYRLNTVYSDISGRLIENEVTTIHGVKGETHAATLVLETKYHQKDIASLVQHILGVDQSKPTGVRKIKFMKQLYVAFTRPEHLLCIAMDKSDFPSSLIGVREHAGWKIHDLTLE